MDETEIAIGRALADLQIHAISFHINPNGNYYHCDICNSESKESNVSIEHYEGCSITSCLAALKSKAGQEEEERNNEG